MIRTWLAGTLVAATAVTGVALGTPASAADARIDPCEFANGTLTNLLTPRSLATHLAVASPYGAVRAAALTALNSPRGEIAVKEFIPAGWCQATTRAEQDAAMNDHIIARVLATHAYETSPWVWSAANAAKTASAAEKEYFVRFGLEEARAADQRARDEDGAHAAALRQYDRDYVATLRDTAQGEQVRLAAAWALRPGATDSDIVEFYTYAWARFGKLDVERFQLTTADQEMRWFAAVDRLKQSALEAQAAAETASGEAQKALQQQAADAWGQVAAGAAPSASGWLAAKQTADAQARQWAAVYQLALRQSGPNWKAMTKPARANRDSWERDARNARDRAAYWQQVVTDALAAEEHIRPDEI
ncbi:hypothetical protein [Micromonospora sp. KC721]|uniref:hypothetical protein n=1 Tax=Micromonospora sp. KC721 TaxID=2530380 RepID=UPI00104A304F|nr:hypothetical protein [Micromonospora sp. KC721]TDB81572.1 hypothetical protein E1182_04870 [Micromonospora sp. KC721]